jgi:2-polyprenyl-3-methyl-5-hydroxy-6-metoxy-1,4-benzoquinol methylase
VKRVLIIASDFAPSGLPPATRVRFFATHLPEFGWEPIVLTVDPKQYEATIDPENEQLLSPSLDVIRTGAFSTRWTRKFGVGDIGMRSLWQHWRAIKRLCREREIDLIFIPVPPYVPMILGRLAHARFGIPYVIDYIDPWVTEYYWKLPKAQRPPKWRASYWLSRTLEPFALRKVSHITGVSKGTTDGVIDSYSWLSPEHATEIPYGAEAGDFEYLRQHPRPNSIFDPNDGLVHMSYVGACIPGMHAAVRAVFQAVRAGLDRSPETFQRLRLHFVGTSYAANGHAPQAVLALAREAGIESLVDEHQNRIPYLASLQVMIDSQALLLVGSDEPHYTASKVFPYVLAERPLLAVVHEDSSVVRILRETNADATITFDYQRQPTEKVNEILAQLERMLGPARDTEPATHWKASESYNARAMTARLADVFGKVRRPQHLPRALPSIQASPDAPSSEGGPICPVCLSRDSCVWGVRTSHQIHECKSCGLAFFDRNEFEAHDYQTYYEYTDDWDDARVAWELAIRRRALSKQLQQIGTYVNGRTILDLGAGPGYLCRVATDLGWDAFGIETSDKARRIGTEFLGVRYTDVKDVKHESFDCITCYHVLEHISQPSDFISQLSSMLKPGGVIAVHVPHREPLSSLMRNRLNLLKRNGVERLCALYVPEHISGFTQNSLLRAFALKGFQPLMVRTCGMWSKYYDPFFLRNYLTERKYVSILKHSARCVIDNLGVTVGLGDWVVGHFRKSQV